MTKDNPPQAPVQDLASRLEQTPNLLSAKQLQLHLNLSRTALYDKVSRGSIPYLRIDNTIRFDPARVAAWLREREVGVDETHEGSRRAA